jgi:hypothetical protein
MGAGVNIGAAEANWGACRVRPDAASIAVGESGRRAEGAVRGNFVRLDLDRRGRAEPHSVARHHGDEVVNALAGRSSASPRGPAASTMSSGRRTDDDRGRGASICAAAVSTSTRTDSAGVNPPTVVRLASGEQGCPSCGPPPTEVDSDAFCALAASLAKPAGNRPPPISRALRGDTDGATQLHGSRRDLARGNRTPQLARKERGCPTWLEGRDARTQQSSARTRSAWSAR